MRFLPLLILFISSIATAELSPQDLLESDFDLIDRELTKLTPSIQGEVSKRFKNLINGIIDEKLFESVSKAKVATAVNIKNVINNVYILLNDAKNRVSTKLYDCSNIYRVVSLIQRFNRLDVPKKILEPSIRIKSGSVEFINVKYGIDFGSTKNEHLKRGFLSPFVCLQASVNHSELTHIMDTHEVEDKLNAVFKKHIRSFITDREHERYSEGMTSSSIRLTGGVSNWNADYGDHIATPELKSAMKELSETMNSILGLMEYRMELLVVGISMEGAMAINMIEKPS